ncbi:MAG: DUF2156 domain-containing protein [Flavobacteriales bacterium]|nr:DUF2156 domain-containing protein [Flavobacteriales bacterium]
MSRLFYPLCQAGVVNFRSWPMENKGERVLAFLNMIPDHTPGGSTYDLIRAATDAPRYAIDLLVVKYFETVKALGYKSVNMGLAPMSGIERPAELSGRALKFAYERISASGHYKGLRAFKEKFAPGWRNKYLVFDHDFDLFFIPMALKRLVEHEP